MPTFVTSQIIRDKFVQGIPTAPSGATPWKHSSGVIVSGNLVASSLIDISGKYDKTGGVISGIVQFGGSTSSFPALKSNGSTLQAKLADDSGFTALKASQLLIASPTTGAVDLSFGGTGTYGLGIGNYNNQYMAFYVGEDGFSMSSAGLNMPFNKHINFTIDNSIATVDAKYGRAGTAQAGVFANNGLLVKNLANSAWADVQAASVIANGAFNSTTTGHIDTFTPPGNITPQLSLTNDGSSFGIHHHY